MPTISPPIVRGELRGCEINKAFPRTPLTAEKNDS
jgi:hypothetical protein